MSIEIIKAFSGQKPIVIYPVYLDITGDYATAAALGQVLYWHEVMRGKFYKTDSDFEQELHLTPKQFRRVKTELKSLPFLKITVEQIPAKTFYDVDYEALAALIGQIRTPPKGGTVPAQKGETITENTTENTTENNNNETDNQPAQAFHVNELLLSLDLKVKESESVSHTEEKAERQKVKVNFPILDSLDLTEREKADANKKLANLSPDQRDIAIQAIKSANMDSDMAYINGLYERGIKGELKPFRKTSKHTPNPKQETLFTPVSGENNAGNEEDSRRETTLEILKLKVAKYKDRMLAEYKQKRAVFIQGLGVFYTDDLAAAGLFD